jgi:SAM-dependent methyltransferase
LDRLEGPLTELESLYRHRFADADRERKDQLWAVLCRRFLQPRLGEGKTVLDLACGPRRVFAPRPRGEEIRARPEPGAAAHLPPDVEFHAGSADHLDFLADDSVDAVFTSNFLEHLPDKATVDRVLAEIHRVLRPGGRFLAIQPNIRFAFAEYWDFWDHYTALFDRSANEALLLAGFMIDEMISRFLPFTTKTALPTHPALLDLYLRLPVAWPLAAWSHRSWSPCHPPPPSRFRAR